MIATIAALALISSLTIAQGKGAAQLRPILLAEPAQQSVVADTITMSCPSAEMPR